MAAFLFSYLRTEICIDEFLAEACTADTDTLLNHIWVADHCGVSEEKKEKLGGCVLALLENKIIGEERLFLRMEPEMLERIGLITSSDLFKRKIIRKNTATLYKQNKFNLFREEPLGYGLVLDTITSDALPEGKTLETVVSLIGEYDLDPNRIAYMVLDMVQIEQRTKPLLNLLSGMNIHEERLLPLLSLKLQNKNTVRSTMSLCFFLAERSIIKHQSISLLLETDTEMDETIKGFFSDTLKHGKKLETVLLTQNALSNEFSLEDRDQRSPAQIHTKRGFYFKLLLEKGDLNAAVSVLEKTPCLLRTHTDYTKALCKEIEIKAPENIEDAEREIQRTKQILAHLGFSLSVDPKLFSTLCSLIELCLSKKTQVDDCYELLQHTVLPASYFIQASAQANQLWRVLSIVPAGTRFSLYKGMRSQLHPELVCLYAAAKRKTKHLLKRLTTENTAAIGHGLATLEAQPIPALSAVFHSVKNYENTAVPFALLFSSQSKYFLDVLLFGLVEELSAMEEKLKPESTFFADGFSALVVFIETLCSYVAEFNTALLVEFLCDGLNKENTFSFVLLSRVLKALGKQQTPAASLLGQINTPNLILQTLLQKNNCARDCKISNTKLLGFLVDLCQETIETVSGVVQGCIPIVEYGEALPPLAGLVESGIDTQNILLFYKPLFPFYPEVKESVLNALWERDLRLDKNTSPALFSLFVETHAAATTGKAFLGIDKETGTTEAENELLLSACFIPKIVSSKRESKRSSELLSELHQHKALGLSHENVLASLLRPSRLETLLRGSTEKEARNFGVFFSSFVQGKGLPEPVLMESVERMLSSGEYTAIRNTILFLEEVSSCFPEKDSTKVDLARLVSAASEKETRDDIKLQLSQYSARMERHLENWRVKRLRV